MNDVLIVLQKGADATMAPVPTVPQTPVEIEDLSATGWTPDLLIRQGDLILGTNSQETP
jgi:hypothetical protein